MRELPIADCFKELYEKENKTFTDSERATLFWNMDLPISEKLAALKEIHDMTTDEVLKKQIKARLDREAEIEEAFMSRDKDYIQLVLLDDSDDADRVFESMDSAIAYGKEECEETFHISKHILEERVSPDDNKDSDKTGEYLVLGGYAAFKKDGTLISCSYYTSRDYSFTFLNHVEPESFEEAYVPVLNPFEYGDIVRVIGDSRPAIYVTPQGAMERTLKICEEHGYPKNYYLNKMTVEYLYPDGEFAHDHPDLLSLEKLESWDNKEEWELLQSISRLMKGHGWVETVLDHYNKNR